MAGFDLEKLDRRSYNLGMIYAFSEVVGSGVKRLGLSPPLTEEEYENVIDDTRLIAEEYGVTLHTDRDFLETLLFNPEYTRGMIVIHLADSRETLDEYLRLKERKKRMEESGELTRMREEEIARGLGALLSYSEEAIERPRDEGEPAELIPPHQYVVVNRHRPALPVLREPTSLDVLGSLQQLNHHLLLHQRLVVGRQQHIIVEHHVHQPSAALDEVVVVTAWEVSRHSTGVEEVPRPQVPRIPVQEADVVAAVPRRVDHLQSASAELHPVSVP